MDHESTPPAAAASSQVPPPSPVVCPGPGGDPPAAAAVADLVASTNVLKRRRAGTHLVPQAGAAGTGSLPAASGRAKDPAGSKPKATKTSRPKSQSSGPKGTKRKSKTTTSRSGVQTPGIPPSPQVAANASDAPDVLDDVSTR